jgi:hypothetical protein
MERNVRERGVVLRSVLTHKRTTDIVLPDLPPECQRGGIEHVERAAINRALAEVDGNKTCALTCSTSDARRCTARSARAGLTSTSHLTAPGCLASRHPEGQRRRDHEVTKSNDDWFPYDAG